MVNFFLFRTRAAAKSFARSRRAKFKREKKKRSVKVVKSDDPARNPFAVRES